jgi:hypothetical protein
MQVKLFDRYQFDASTSQVRKTVDGFMTAMPRVARTGIQLYSGAELGIADKKVVRIYRSPEEVFKADSLHTYAHRPVTDDHPPVPVTADNWRTYSRGQTGDEVARDGDFVRVPMVLMDAGLIKKVEDGKAELSQGYVCDLEMTPGTTPDGEPYDGYQKDIRINHTAVVDAGRAGSKARIGDGTGETRTNFSDYAAAFAALIDGKVNKSDELTAPDGFLGKGNKYPIAKDGTVYVAALRAAATDSIVKGDGDVLAAVQTLLSQVDAPAKPVQDKSVPAHNQETTNMKTMTVDGITVQVGDGNDGEIIQRHIKGLNDQLTKVTTDAATAATDHAKTVTAKDAEIAKLTTDLTAATTKVTTLETQLKDAELTPAKLDKLVADRKVVGEKAKVLHPAVVVDGKTDAEIRRQVVDAKLGDAAKGWTDEQVTVSFDTLAAGVKAPAAQVAQRPGGFTDQAAHIATARSGDGATVRDQALADRNTRLTNAWQNPGGSTAKN